MKNAIRISVETPCHEKFEDFKKTDTGGFCGSCEKEVIDFTAMTSAELVTHFSNSSKTTCGRFKKSQLKTYHPMKNTSNTSFVSRGLAIMSFSLLSLCAIQTTNAQDVATNENPTEVPIQNQNMLMGKIAIQKHTVTGTVLDEEKTPLPGTNVVLKGTAIGTQTDFDGKFEFPRALEAGDILVFSYIGFETKEYTIEDGAPEALDITINFDFSDIELLGEVVVGEVVYKSKRNIFQKIGSIFKK